MLYHGVGAFRALFTLEMFFYAVVLSQSSKALRPCLA